MSEAWLVIDAAEENYELQGSALVRSADLAPQDAILTTTSFFSPLQELVQGSHRDYVSRVIGLRYVNSVGE